MGVNDDWSYTLTARELASSGRLVYNGWASVMIGPQAYWAALFIKLFGFSFAIVRLSTIILVLVCIPVLYALGREAGLRPSFASFAVLCCIFSPVFVPEAISFMTDAPALCLAVVCLLAFVRAWKAESVRSCVMWTAIATVAGGLAGCTRQIYWLLPLTCLPVIAYVRFKRRERATAAFAGVALLVTILTLVAVLRWFNAQPYAVAFQVIWPRESLRTLVAGAFHRLIKILETCALLLIPLLIFYVGPSRRLFSRKIWIAGALAVAGGFLLYESRPIHWPPRLGNIITKYGILSPRDVVLGWKPVLLTPAIRLGLAAFMFATAAAFLAVALRTTKTRSFPEFRRSALWRFLALTFPFALVSVLVLVTQTWTGASLFDRYLIEFLPILSIPILWLYQTYIQDHVPTIGWVTLLVFAIYATATTHDAFALSRARLGAAEALRGAGVPRTEIMAGFEYDGQTEVEASGYFNDPRITKPASAFRRVECTGPSELQQYWVRPYTPSLRQRYFVVTSRLAGLIDAPPPPVPYKAWLPPYRGEVFTQMLPDGSAIECR